ncbi:MAG: ubiquinone biosynthesis protein [Tepidanaerobacteraceae bacterium]|nr:ubiquinone biosynthesis protein [Tepidanaerobacteraceae bacterium]
MRLSQLNTTYLHAKRYREIINVIVKYGFGFLVEKVGFVRLIKREKYRELGRLTAPERVRLMLEELGPTFIKFGQILASRPDLIPQDYIEELKKLHDRIPGVGFESIKRQVEKELGKAIEEVYSFFDPHPFAAASIAQVHRAMLKGGQEVVVKVQRPGIERIIRADLDILHNLAKLAEKHIPESRLYDPVGLVSEFARAMQKELDFTKEAWNVEKFRRNFEGDISVYVPKVFWEYTTRKVLTIEYVNGVRVDQIDKISKTGISKKKIAENGARAILKQIFVHGFFHADPHPGNILVRPDGSIAFIDFGMVGRIDRSTMRKMAEIMLGVISKDEERIVNLLLEIGASEKRGNLEELMLDVQDILDRYYGKTLKEINMPELINEIFLTAGRHGIKIPSKFALLCKAILTIDGIGRQLYPEFDFIKAAKPFVKQLFRERYNPKYFTKDIRKNITNIMRSSAILPDLIDEIYNKVKRESIKIDFEYNGLEKFAFELNRMANRLVFSLIVASLIVGSSLVVRAGIGPTVGEMPLMGILGFVLAGLLGLGLLISILKTGIM